VQPSSGCFKSRTRESDFRGMTIDFEIELYRPAAQLHVAVLLSDSPALGNGYEREVAIFMASDSRLNGWRDVASY
jgi:hypothetical protein